MASDNLPFPELVADATSAEVRLILGIPLELPLELRRKIWHIYFGPQLGRIIEIEWDPTHLVDKNHGYRATKLSSQALLGLRDPICRDTRDEILKKYQLWRFDNRPGGHNPPSRLTYFDPSIDTVYFDYNTCFGTMGLFVDSLARGENLLSRVAIGDFYYRENCCVRRPRIESKY